MSNDKHDIQTQSIEPVSTSLSRDQSLVFISHDTRDAELAEAFSKLLSSVSAGVLKAFRSSDKKGTQGIEYGVEWFPEIMKNLNSASDVVCLLTRRSVDRPWILYEAGVAKGRLDTPVYGLALGIPLNQANTGPFAQFQNTGDDIESITKLVMQLLRRIPNAEPDYEAVQMQVQTFKTKSEEILAHLDGPQTTTEEEKFDGESVSKLFEEVKVMFQDLPSRIDNKIASAVIPTTRAPKTRRRYENFIRLSKRLSHYLSSEGRSGSIVWLVMIGHFRDDCPWIYESGMEVYQAMRLGHPQSILKAFEDFREVLDFTMHHTMLRDIAYDSKEAYMLLEEACMLLESSAHKVIISAPLTTADKSLETSHEE